ncbi:MAG: L-aspartate oxidase [Candidatus Diapherotrites archaeon CG08_land_8_20_14_0_20_34_12]|nr:MAG: L-aspartate oxidase [Candidatus Diapherotrites archaeon CG08_land_8_20_14_0_20_34_12]
MREFLCNFNSKHLNKEEFDSLIIGNGLAGLVCAYYASKNPKKRIALITKEIKERSTSMNAQGGIAVALGKNDSWEKHLKDTVVCGTGLTNKKIAKILVKNAIKDIKELMALGLKFDSDERGLEFGKEGMHSVSRILHINGDATGAGLVRFMENLVNKQKNIQIFKKTYAIDILTKNNTAYGILAEIKDYGKKIFYAKDIVLASGGYASIYQNTTNPKNSLGDGIAMAYRAGAIISDTEFVQFHPTTVKTKDRNYLISEAVRGEGAILVNENNERFMLKESRLGELAGRDIVSRAVFDQMQNKHTAYLDCTALGKEFFKERFPSIFNFLKEHGIDPSKDKIKIEPAAHYCIGGIKVNGKGMTSIKNLYACGECSCSGINGANRLPSNSLLGAVVFGKIVGQTIANKKTTAIKATTEYDKLKYSQHEDYESKIDKIGKLMWGNVGIKKDAARLEKALKEIRLLKKRLKSDNSFGYFKTKNMLAVAELTTAMALSRKESRGTHYRTDFPKESNKWLMHQTTRLN